MKIQWSILLALLFALLVAVFAVVNVESVPVDYIFGRSSAPLILVILGSALFGGLTVGAFGIVRQFRLARRIRSLEHQIAETEARPSEPETAIPAASDHTLQAEPSESPNAAKTHP